MVRARIIDEFNTYKSHVVHTLSRSPSQVHIAFDGWTSRNRHSFFSINAFFLDEDIFQPRKIVLGLPNVAIAANIYPSNGDRRLPAFMVGMGESGNVSQAIGNVASSLKKWMRDRELEASPLVGEATRVIVIAKVRWNCLGFPAATLLVRLVFALLSTWKTHWLRRPAWKDWVERRVEEIMEKIAK